MFLNLISVNINIFLFSVNYIYRILSHFKNESDIIAYFMWRGVEMHMLFQFAEDYGCEYKRPSQC